MSKAAAFSLTWRLTLLALCLFVGCVIGLLGVHFTDSSAWFLAVPALVLGAWLFVADPTECLPPNERPPHNRSASE